jgi:hypothetical protein
MNLDVAQAYQRIKAPEVCGSKTCGEYLSERFSIKKFMHRNTRRLPRLKLSKVILVVSGSFITPGGISKITCLPFDFFWAIVRI